MSSKAITSGYVIRFNEQDINGRIYKPESVSNIESCTIPVRIRNSDNINSLPIGIAELSKDNIGVKADVTITDDIYSKLLEHLSIEDEPVSIGIRCIGNIDKESNIVSSVTNIHSLYIGNNCTGDKVSFTDKK